MNNHTTRTLSIILVILIIVAGFLIAKEVFIEKDDAKKLEELKQNETIQTASARRNKRRN